MISTSSNSSSFGLSFKILNFSFIMMFPIRRVSRKPTRFPGSSPLSLWHARASKMPREGRKVFYEK